LSTIHLTTFIEAPIERVFDLSRSITLHTKSLEHTKEKAIAGVISGLINLNEIVTWQAKHFFKTRILQSKITAMTPHTFFCDEMVKGDFKSMKHEHHFKPATNGTIMIDMFSFETPYGFFGKIANALFLKSYLQKLLEGRNKIIKDYAETGKWKHVL
jgi:ligand-binding SRPBCC domain-containing protein